MTTSIVPWLRELASPRRSPVPAPGGRRAAALLLRLGCVGLLAWIGAVHLHLWLEGYRQIPTDGPLFLLDAVTGLALAALLLVWAAPLAALIAAGYTASTLGALLISLSVGLFGFRESRRPSSPSRWPLRRSPCLPCSAGPPSRQPSPGRGGLLVRHRSRRPS